jgi:hypothetical protein
MKRIGYGHINILNWRKSAVFAFDATVIRGVLETSIGLFDGHTNINLTFMWLKPFIAQNTTGCDERKGFIIILDFHTIGCNEAHVGVRVEFMCVLTSFTD